MLVNHKGNEEKGHCHYIKFFMIEEMKWIGKEVSICMYTFTDCACEFIILKSPMKLVI